MPDDLPLWQEVTANAEQCLGRDCPQHLECFVTRMKERAAESDLVIVNHHLLCADASVRQGGYGEVIPECDLAVIDEAHQLEDVGHDVLRRGREHASRRRARARCRGSGWSDTRPAGDGGCGAGHGRVGCAARLPAPV
jgi:Rad3-related DNA helicase